MSGCFSLSGRFVHLHGRFLPKTYGPLKGGPPFQGNFESIKTQWESINMAALRDRRHEKVAQLLAVMKTPEEASREAGYRDGTSFAANARKRAQRPEIKARVAELQAKEAELVAIDAAWIRRKTAEVAGVELEAEQIKASDKVAALSLLAKMTVGALVPQKLEATGADGAAIVVEIVRFATDKNPSAS